MIEKSKPQDVLFLTMLVIISVISGLDTNIYIQFFPQIIKYFHIEEKNAEYIIRFSLAGALVSGLIIGPLDDSYGRKKIFIGGLLLYSISSFSCFISQNFESLLFWRFIQGASKSSLIIVGWIIAFDIFSMNKSGKVLGFVRGISTLILAIIPLFFFYISNLVGWHNVFLSMVVLSLVSLIIAILFVNETHPVDKRKKFSFIEALQQYSKLIKNFNFIAYIIIYSAASGIYNIYFSNASIIYVENLMMTKQEFSMYQTINAAIYIIFSFLSIRLIENKGIDYTKNIGFLLFIIGCLAMFIFSEENKTNYHNIFNFMMVVSMGGALMNGFLLKAINIFPESRGTCMSFNNLVATIFSARAIFWSQKLFDGTILPTTTIILICAIVTIILFIILQYREKLKEKIN
ncbi:MAG: MFS transporter [Rickettsiales bacterium]